MPNLMRLAAAFDRRAHGRAAADGADRDRHRLFRPRRFLHGRRRPAQAPRRARRGAVRLCRRRDPHAGVLRRRRAGAVVDVAAVRPRRSKPGGCTGCASKASGCMSARPRRWPPPRPRWSRARRNVALRRAFAGSIVPQADRSCRADERICRHARLHDSPAPRLHHSGLGAVPADADPRAARRHAGRGLLRHAAIRSRSPPPRSICRRGAPAGWRATSSST